MNDTDYDITKICDVIIQKKQTIKDSYKDIHDLEQLLRVELDNNNATELSIEGYIVTAEPNIEYDQNQLAVLLEILDPQELIEDGALVAEHTTVIKQKFNVRKLMKFGKRGKDIREIIDNSRITKSTKLKITPK